MCNKLFIFITVLISMLSTAGFSQRPNHVTLRKNSLISEQVTKPNTIYKIGYTFDLGGDTLAIPEGCVLKFKGGKITNGTLILNDSYLEGSKGFQNVVLVGTCANKELFSDLFVLDKKGKIDNSVDVQSLFNVGVEKISFSKGTYSFSDIHVGNVCINANGSTFISTLAQDGFSVINNIFVASNTDYFKLYDATIKGHLDGSPRIQKLVLSPMDLTNVNKVVIKDCSFKELRYGCYQAFVGGQYDYRGVSLSCHGCKDVLIENCEFYDLGPSEWTWIAPAASGSWDDVEMVRFKNNYFHNPKGDIVRSNTPVNVFSRNVIFEDNLLEYQKYVGSAFNLQSRNVIARGNVVKHSYFMSIVDTCEYGDFCNDQVEIYNNDFSAYNAQCVVANSKELIVKDNKFAGLSAVLAYATYYNPEMQHPNCPDFATSKATPNQHVIIEGNDCDCDYVDTAWTSNGKMVQGRSISGFTVQGAYCISDSVTIRNNKLYIRKIAIDNFDKRCHQPILIRNAKNITISDNYIDSNVPAVGSKYQGAIYIEVYDGSHVPYSRLTEIESVNILNNQYRISADNGPFYAIRIAGTEENINDWRVNSSNIYGNVVLGGLKGEQIFTTGGHIERLTVDEGEMDLKNSPVVIRDARRLDGTRIVVQGRK